MPGTTVVRSGGEGDAYWVLGGLYEVKASGAETGNDTTVMEMTIPPGAGAPPHTHPGPELVYVLEGTVHYHIGDEVHEGGPGSFFHIPEGVVEFFEAAGDENLRILVLYRPGGIDRFFAEVGEVATERTLPPPSEEPPDFERIVAVAREYGMDITAPAAS